MQLRTAILAALAGLTLLLAMAGGALYWVLHTESGRDAVVTWVESRLPEGSRLGSVEGVLAGPLRLTDSRIVTDAAIIELDHVELDWSARALFERRLHVHDLAVGNLTVQLPDDPADPDAVRVPELPETMPVPLSVQLDAFSLASVTIRQGDDYLAGPFAATFAANLDEARLRLDSVDIRSPWGTVAGDAEMAMSAPYAINGMLDWATEEVDRVRHAGGSLRIGGNAETLELDLRATHPEELRVQGRIHPLREPLAWDLSIRAPILRAERWISDVEPVRLDNPDLRLAGSLVDSRLTGRVDVDHVDTGRIGVDLDLRAGLSEPAVPALVLEYVELESERYPGALRASGNLRWPEAGPRADLELVWQDVQVPLDSTDIESATGRLRVAGRPDAYQFEGEFGLRPGELPTGRWQVRGRGNRNELHVAELLGDWFEADWDMTGRVSWQEGLSGEATLALRGIEPMALDVPVVGQIDLATSLVWSLREDGPHMTAELDRVDGDLGGQSLSGGGRVVLAGDDLHLHDFRLRAGGTELDVDGRVLPRPQLDFALNAPDLSGLVMDGHGALQASGRIRGQLPYPSLRMQIEGGNLVWRDHRIRELRFRADLPTDLDVDAQLDLDAQGLHLAGVDLTSVRLGLDGTLTDHSLNVRAAVAGASMQARVTGQAAEDAWAGRLEQMELRFDNHPDWRLLEPAGMQVARDAATLERACLVPVERLAAHDTRACNEFVIGRDGNWSVDGEGQELPLAFLAYWLGPDILTASSIDYRISAGGVAGQPFIGSLDVDVSPGDLAYIEDDEADERIQLLAWNAGQVRAVAESDRFLVDMNLPLRPDGYLRGNMRMERGIADPPISASVELESAQLALLGRLIPEVGRIDGRLAANLDLRGSIQSPQIDGSVELADGRLRIPRLGLLLEDLRMDLAGEDGVLRGRVGARSGEGRVEATVAALRDREGWQFEGDILGEDVLVLATPDGRLVVSPDVNWTIRERRVRLEGQVHVPFADLHPRDFTGAVRQSGDVVVIREDEDPLENDDGWTVEADVRVSLGDDVHFRGFGLRGRLAGELLIQERPDQLTSATGELEVVDGVYRAYRQELQIERGRLLYDGGPLATPGLDIRAVRRPRNVMVGVAVRGTLQEPTVELFSEPPMPESQMISYLVLGMPLREADDDNQAALVAATAGAGWATDRYGGMLGVDDVAVQEGATPDETELILGTWLSPRLYVSYGVGLFESFARMRMRYLLTQRWSVEAESGPTSSADLIFTIER